MASINAKLRDLRLRRPSREDLEEINYQTAAEDNDRGAALLITALVEGTLATAIIRHLRINSHLGALFDNNGPLSTLEARDVFAFALGIIGVETHHNLGIVRHVRNTFAHASAPVTFATPEIAEACEALRGTDPKGEEWQDARHRFTGICFGISTNLVNYAAKCVRIRADRIDPSAMVPVMPAPLP